MMSLQYHVLEGPERGKVLDVADHVEVAFCTCGCKTYRMLGYDSENKLTSVHEFRYHDIVGIAERAKKIHDGIEKGH